MEAIAMMDTGVPTEALNGSSTEFNQSKVPKTHLGECLKVSVRLGQMCMPPKALEESASFGIVCFGHEKFGQTELKINRISF